MADKFMYIFNEDTQNSPFFNEKMLLKISVMNSPLSPPFLTSSKDLSKVKKIESLVASKAQRQPQPLFSRKTITDEQ